MTNNAPTPEDRAHQIRAIETAIRLGFVILVVAWCFRIVQPFVMLIAWGVIIAVAISPIYEMIRTRLGGRRKLAASLLTLVLLVLLMAPTLMLTESLIAGAEGLVELAKRDEVSVPPPPEGVAGWPVIGKQLYAIWSQASTNLEGVLTQFAPEIVKLGTWLLSKVAGTGLGILQFVLSIIIAGVLLANTEAGKRATEALAIRLAGEEGREYAKMARATVQSVARGILGVALIQASLVGIGFIAVGIPAAGLWVLIALILGVIQLGVVFVTIPAVIYVFSTADTTPAVLFLIWNILVTPLDNVLKPILLGRGAPVPMIVIFLGAIGGFLTAGIIGLFVGAVVLSLGFKLYEAWLGGPTEKTDVASATSDTRR